MQVPTCLRGQTGVPFPLLGHSSPLPPLMLDNRARILDAAARVYAEYGYRGATTRRIAVAAGVNEITLFRHFGSKDALLREALARCQDRGSETLLPESPVDPLAELLAWAGSHITDMRGRQALIRTCMGEF